MSTNPTDENSNVKDTSCDLGKLGDTFDFSQFKDKVKDPADYDPDELEKTYNAPGASNTKDGSRASSKARGGDLGDDGEAGTSPFKYGFLKSPWLWIPIALIIATLFFVNAELHIKILLGVSLSIIIFVMAWYINAVRTITDLGVEIKHKAQKIQTYEKTMGNATDDFLGELADYEKSEGSSKDGVGSDPKDAAFDEVFAEERRKHEANIRDDSARR